MHALGALSDLTSVEDCGRFSLTVRPVLEQAFALPAQVWVNIGDVDALKGLYAETNPLVTGFVVSLLLACLFFVSSEVNRNYSQVDRMWSILPAMYVLHLATWARMAGLPHLRIDLVAALTTVWGVRRFFQGVTAMLALV